MNPIHVPQVFALLIVTLHQAVAFEKPADCEQMMIEKGINALKVHKGTNTDEKAYGDLVLNSKLGRRFWEYGIQQHCKFSGAEFPHTSNCPENSGEDRIFICLREQMERETFDKGPAQEHIQYFFALANQAGASPFLVDFPA